MPHNVNLDLQEPLEEDIGDGLNSYMHLSLASSHGDTAASSTTLLHSPFSAGSNLRQGPVQQSINHLNSSSPALVHSERPPRLSRSNTLPRVFQIEHKRRQSNPAINALSVDPRALKQIRKWIFGIAVVDFDLDDGPVVDGIYPPLILLPSEAENIAFSAFPDSPQFEQGSQCHSFRIREQWTASYSNEKRPQSRDGFIYGHAYFIQRKDSLSKRGYQQRSLVILTQHQYPAFFSSLVSIFGPLFEIHGVPMLESACHNIATWCDPTPGETMEVGFVGTVLYVELPYSVDEQQLTETSSFNEKYNPGLHILASTTPLTPPPMLLFEASLSSLWSIWECLVLGEPILVFGVSPAQTSQAIWWLRDLLRPIPLAGDIRPYFTMQDGDHSLLVNKMPPKSGVILGVTNPFFEKSCAHWPHTLSLGRRIMVKSSQSKNATAKGAGPIPGWKTTTHKRYISKDHSVLKQLESALRGDEQAQLNASLIMRRHFSSRTKELLIPLSRYLNTLIPTPTEVTRARAPFSHHTLRLKPFSSVNFFTSLKAHGSTLPFKSNSKRTEFYERWLKTPAFGMWLAQQEVIVQAVLDESTIQLS